MLPIFSLLLLLSLAHAAPQVSYKADDCETASTALPVTFTILAPTHTIGFDGTQKACGVLTAVSSAMGLPKESFSQGSLQQHSTGASVFPVSSQSTQAISYCASGTCLSLATKSAPIHSVTVAPGLSMVDASPVVPAATSSGSPAKISHAETSSINRLPQPTSARTTGSEPTLTPVGISAAVQPQVVSLLVLAMLLIFTLLLA
ncbi:hypothetical protein CABS01_16510 [Colletotrichum abscissum]|uniref:uncharacterized protein n=1 Tax=Colletotrichum abscissum TaxID=1671311 RepID=UPI0027D618ED|nr:uncharacterized protein CABS01_16510 [Colletotrichum abscissum]KAK1521606.1 hypothetical protein CABS01_16510 [Colletotrichum abscissum]